MEPIQHRQHQRRRRNSTKVNLTLSLVLHGLLFAAAAYWAAHEGVFGKKIQELSVLLVPKEKKAEEARKDEAETEAAKLQETAVKAQESTRSAAVAPPPPVAAPPPAADAGMAAPPPAMLPTFSFGDLGGTVAASEDAVGTYRQYLENTLRSAWERPEDAADLSYVAEVEVRLDGAGQIGAHEMKKASGDKRWDDSVLKAIASVKSVRRPPPAGFPGAFLIRFDVTPAPEPLLQ